MVSQLTRALLKLSVKGLRKEKLRKPDRDDISPADLPETI
jgi:hypothetical protein